MSTKHINENYMHDCGCEKLELKNCVASITEMGFSENQVVDLLDFYLFHAPIIKDKNSKNPFNFKSLQEYGWKGNPDLSKLEGRLLKSSGIGMFCFIKADKIDGTLNSMNLSEKICVEHPRAVIKQNCSVSIQEDGAANVTPNESRMECLFRHLRNSFAHNHSYMFENNNILLEDCDDTKKISARILMPKQALIDWMNIVKNKENS